MSNIVFFETPYEIQKPYVPMAWTSVAGQGDWANSGATTLVVKAETLDQDTGGNTEQSLKARTSATSTIEVDIITHKGTSGSRSVVSEQAFIPCAGDGSFEYYWARTSINGELSSFKVVGYLAKDAVVPGTGDLCKLLPNGNGYQMFRNGLTIQWVSSPAFITESSQVVNFPIPFAAKPFKVTASTRYPSDDPSSEQWIQVASWDATSVTIRAQSQNVGSWAKPVYADIIAMGIVEVTDCPALGGEDPEGIKVSELVDAQSLKDDDLFLISRDNETDGTYDTSKNVTMSSLTEGIKNNIQSSLPKGGSSGFQRTNCMCSPSVLTGTNGQQWVYTVSYGGSSGGYHMSMFDIDGTFIGHLFPNSAAGNSNAPSWPYGHTSGWAASWPQTWIDGSMGLNSGYAWMWVKHSSSYVFSMKLNLTTGLPYMDHGKDRNNQPAGEYWATEGVHAAGPNGLGSYWNIIGQDAGNLLTTWGYEDGQRNQANRTECYVMARGGYNSGHAAHNYTGNLRYLPQCSAGLNGSLNGSQHNQSYIMVAGINPTSGRVYLHRKGCDDVMTVMQLSQADGTGPTRWYRAWYSMLKTAPDQPNTGTYKLNYVTQFAIPDAINAQGGNQTTSYQVQFTTPTAANPNSVPTYLTRGGHWNAWNYGGAQVIPWQTSWET